MKTRTNAPSGSVAANFAWAVEIFGSNGSPLLAAAPAFWSFFAANSRRENAAAVHISGAAIGVSAGSSPDAVGAIPNHARAPEGALAGLGAAMLGVDFAAAAAAGALTVICPAVDWDTGVADGFWVVGEMILAVAAGAAVIGPTELWALPIVGAS